ncbi:MAG: hypothetical protein DCC71_15290, partial [Proteobacteria bacterium]
MEEHGRRNVAAAAARERSARQPESRPARTSRNWRLRLAPIWISPSRIGSHRLPDVLDLVFRPDPAHRHPVYRQLADHLTALIAEGRLAPGERLPPSRELAAALGLSRNTVTRAYDWLVETGHLGAHVGRGTFVQAAPRRAPAARALAPVPTGL